MFVYRYQCQRRGVLHNGITQKPLELFSFDLYHGVLQKRAFKLKLLTKNWHMLGCKQIVNCSKFQKNLSGLVGK